MVPLDEEPGWWPFIRPFVAFVVVIAFALFVQWYRF
jgi:hypothetical protein